MKNERNVSLGLLFIIGGLFFFSRNLGFFNNINLISIVLTFFLFALVVVNLRSRNFVVVSIAIGGILFINQPLFNVQLQFFSLAVASLLIGIGLQLLFGGRKDITFTATTPPQKESMDEATCNTTITSEQDTGNQCIGSVSFGESVRYITSNQFSTGIYSCNFGSLKLHFTPASIVAEGARLDLTCTCGEIILYIPSTYSVHNTISSSFGNVKDARMHEQDASAPQLLLSGTVNLGSIEIVYV